MRTSLPEEWLARYWFIWAFAAEACAAASALVIVTILVRPKLRTQSFNKFVVGLALPDFIFSFLCGIQCLTHVLHGSWFGGDFACSFQSLYCIYGFAASMWMNLVIAVELRRLASAMARSRNYDPPSDCSVYLRIAGVHCAALLFGALPLGLVPGLPADIGRHRGLACLPMEYDLASTVFHWAFTMNLMLVVPLLIILWNFLYVYRLLAPKKSTMSEADRAIFIFFARLLLVFVVMWLPAGVVIWMSVWDHPAQPHIGYWGGFWTHWQGMVSAVLYMRKPDINAELRLWMREMCAAARHSPGLEEEIGMDFEMRSTGSLTSAESTEEMTSRLSEQVMSEVQQQEQLPMRVMEFNTWLQVGHFPRSSEAVVRPVQDGDIVVFVSHRWWRLDCPDDDKGSKYDMLCCGLQKLVAKHRLDAARVVLWCDWSCIEQDDLELQSLGIASLIAYAARADVMLIPVADDSESTRALRNARHPMDLHNYGERAWCRLEAYIFMCVAEIRQRPMICYGCGHQLSAFCLSARIGLQPLVGGSATGAAFDLSKMPSSGALTVEGDRNTIHRIEESMRDIYVRGAILGQRMRFEASARRHVCKLSEKQVRFIDMPFLARAFGSPTLGPRLRKLYLDGNLIDADAAEVLMKNLVCSPETLALKLLNLSRNPKLGAAGVAHIAQGLADPRCLLAELLLSHCGLGGDAVAPLAETIPLSSSLRRLDVAYNKIDDTGCDTLLAACGGYDRPVVDVRVEGNPLSQECFGRCSRVKAIIELKGLTSEVPTPRSSQRSFASLPHSFVCEDEELTKTDLDLRSNDSSTAYSV